MAYNKKYYEQNKEKINESQRKYENKPSVKKKRKEYTKNYCARQDVKEHRKEYYKKNKDKMVRWAREYYQDNKEHLKDYCKRPEVKEKQKEYYSKPEVKVKRKETHKKWIEKNPNYNKEYRVKNEKKIKDYLSSSEYKEKRSKNRTYRTKMDGEYRTTNNLRRSFNKALKKYSNTGKIMPSNKYGINYKEIIEHLKPFPKDIENYHVDHIIPVSWFNHNDPAEIRWAWAPENLQWLSKEKNISKGNKFISVGNF